MKEMEGASDGAEDIVGAAVAAVTAFSAVATVMAPVACRITIRRETKTATNSNSIPRGGQVRQ